MFRTFYNFKICFYPIFCNLYKILIINNFDIFDITSPTKITKVSNFIPYFFYWAI